MRKLRMWWHMLRDTNGKFFVVYRIDKKQTAKMRYSEAKGYSYLFGGEIYYTD